MGNIITFVITRQAKLAGIGDLEGNYVKRCDGCGCRQYTSNSTCRFCGGRCRVISLGSEAPPIPAYVHAADPVTGEMVPYVVNSSGALVRLPPDFVPKAPLEPPPAVEAIDVEDIIAAVTRAANLIDPERKVVGISIIGAAGKQADLSNSRQLHESLHDTKSSSSSHTHEVPTCAEIPGCVPQAIKAALDSVQCSVCLEVYDEPATLQCGHSLCLRHSREVGGKCPICRASFLPYHVVAWKNARLSQLSKAALALESAAK